MYLKLLGFLFLALTSIIPLRAQADNGHPVLGSYTCSQKVPCPNDGGVSSDQWAAYGNSCIMTAFGYTSPNGFIDPGAGLDGGGCLTSSSVSDSRLTPRCCVVERQPNSCVIHCDLAR